MIITRLALTASTVHSDKNIAAVSMQISSLPSKSRVDMLMRRAVGYLSARVRYVMPSLPVPDFAYMRWVQPIQATTTVNTHRCTRVNAHLQRKRWIESQKQKLEQ